MMDTKGETIPKEQNHVRLSKDLKDVQWGMPMQLVTSVDYDENDEKILKDFFFEQGKEMLEKSEGVRIFVCQPLTVNRRPDLTCWRMGGVRSRGKIQLHLCSDQSEPIASFAKNVFVTDGACMTSTGNQSPSILYMALTARAANHAVSELKKQNL